MHAAIQADTPESIKPHAADYQDRAWENYSFEELGSFVHLLAKRATHRATGQKAEKDLYDAQNYLNMIQAKLDSYKLVVRERFANEVNVRSIA